MGGSGNNKSNNDRSINRYNIVNALAYLLNVFVTFAIGQFGLGGRPSNGELSDKYQTIVTPSGWAFSIWGPIFIFQAIWMLWQFLPAQRNADGVMAVGYNYLWVVLAQAGWTLSFSWEINWLALICMYGILFWLVWIHINLRKVNQIWKGYFLWQFPMSLHLGWIAAASAVNTNLVVVGYARTNVTAQLAVAGLTLALLLLGAVATLIRYYPVDFCIPAVLVWALGAVYNELKDPKNSITDRFSPFQIQSIQYGVLAGLAAILFGIVIKVFYVCAWRLNRPKRMMLTRRKRK